MMHLVSCHFDVNIKIKYMYHNSVSYLDDFQVCHIPLCLGTSNDNGTTLPRCMPSSGMSAQAWDNGTPLPSCMLSSCMSRDSH